MVQGNSYGNWILSVPLQAAMEGLEVKTIENTLVREYLCHRNRQQDVITKDHMLRMKDQAIIL
jgi:S-adenosylhomocysteine hydrolase